MGQEFGNDSTELIHASPRAWLSLEGSLGELPPAFCRPASWLPAWWSQGPGGFTFQHGRWLPNTQADAAGFLEVTPRLVPSCHPPAPAQRGQSQREEAGTPTSMAERPVCPIFYWGQEK